MIMVLVLYILLSKTKTLLFTIKACTVLGQMSNGKCYLIIKKGIEEEKTKMIAVNLNSILSYEKEKHIDAR
jgi:hypothetical protein